MKQAYIEAGSGCKHTGLTLLLFDGGSNAGAAVSRARASAEAVLFERGLRKRGQVGLGGRLLPSIGLLVANLSNASLDLALSSRSVASAEPDCMVHLPSHEEPIQAR